MARVATTNLNLGTWVDNENPGAGSQTVDNNGLNGNALKLDVAIGTEHNTNGTHKSNIIDKGNLKTTVCDGSTLEKDGTVGLRIKDLGVTSAKISANAVIAGKLADGAIETAARIVDAIITGAKLVAATITGAKVAANTLTSANEHHDNGSRKNYFTFGGVNAASVSTVLNQQGVVVGIAMVRACCVTGFSVRTSGGNTHVPGTGWTYTTSGAFHFAANDVLTVVCDGTGAIDVYKNGGTKAGGVTGVATGASLSVVATVEVENDDYDI